MASKTPSAPVEKRHELQPLVDACNEFEIKDRWIIPSGHAYFCLPDINKKLKIFGVIQPNALKTIAWPKYGFEIVTDMKEVRSRVSGIDEIITQGRFVIPNVGLEPRQMTDQFDKMNLDYFRNEHFPALKGSEEKSFVGVIAGHSDLKFPDKLGASLGILQVGVHLTLYHRGKDNELSIFVQHRSHLASSYKGMLDQTTAGGYLAAESIREGIVRESAEEYFDIADLPDVKNAPYGGAVVFAGIRPKEADKLEGTIEISAKASFSFEVDQMKTDPKDPRTPPKKEADSVKRDPNVGWFEWMTTAEVMKALKDKRFKPNCALVMIKFLIDKEVIKSDERGFDSLKKSLVVPIPLPLPKNLGEYKPGLE